MTRNLALAASLTLAVAISSGERRAGAAEGPASRPALLTRADWLSMAAGSLEAEHQKEYLPRSTSGNAWLFYNLAYGIDGNTAMFEATGERRFLDRSLLYAENVVKSARPSRDLPASQYK